MSDMMKSKRQGSYKLEVVKATGCEAREASSVESLMRSRLAETRVFSLEGLRPAAFRELACSQYQALRLLIAADARETLARRLAA
jgi:hypothetical protein